MKKYKFEQFNTILTDPTITINEATIGLNRPNGTASVEITLETKDSKLYGVLLTDMPLYALSLDDNDINVLVANKLKEYEVEA